LEEDVAGEGAEDFAGVVFGVHGGAKIADEADEALFQVLLDLVFGFEGFSGIGVLELMDEDEFLKGFAFYGAGFGLGIEDGFELALFFCQDLSGLGVVVVTHDPGHVAEEVGMFGVGVVHLRGEFMSGERLGSRVGEEPGDVEECFVLVKDEEVFATGELPKAIIVLQ